MKASQEQKDQCRKQLARLINRFGQTGLLEMVDSITSPVTIRAWVYRGRISAVVAHEICKHPEVKAAGFTRETLRPDVLVWWKRADE